MKDNISETRSSLMDRLIEIHDGNNIGYTTGFKRLDLFTGLHRKGRIMLIGGATKVGKSYYAINMLDGLINQEEKKRILVISTEMRSEDYLLRYACMRHGVWEIEIERDIKKHIKWIDEELKDIELEAQQKGNEIMLVGGVMDIKDIMEAVEKTKPDIVLIDHVHDLDGNSDMNIRMSEITVMLKEIANQDVAVVAFAQLKNGAEFEEKPVNPFDYGKKLLRICDTALMLRRETDDNGRMGELLSVEILRSRRAMQDKTVMTIQKGYKLKELSATQVTNILNS